ncbi:AMP-binding protein [Nonomuraea soli]|uniref:Acyl-CoA synthetase (AMP-forming)/AMP-acid ligase II n=1 Tax=Nonomuraea soli TaxID=1032476 RepID=A0A7W0CRP3_9ACTN|nr:AMP-binding protein [Nonomuraea soli]MBA2896052.1 acyl-CoA synthetase (AMP-forming)/AMP-acid ligase II [Nonomuraea soli]
MDVATPTLTHEVFGAATAHGDRPALVDLHGGRVYGYRRLAAEVAAAASGLVRRGARPDQVVGVLAGNATTQTLAVHTAIAAGGIAAPIDPRLPVEEVVRLLRSWDARTLFVTQDLAPAALRAADASRVRQVVCFGPADGTLDFAELLALAPVALPEVDPRGQVAMVLRDGVAVTHAGMLARMAELDRPVGLDASDVVLATCPIDAALATLGCLVLARGAMLVGACPVATADPAGTCQDFGVTVTASGDGPPRRV